MHKPIVRLFGLALLNVGLLPAVLAEDFTIDRLLAAQCAQCHGTNGESFGEMERLDDESYKDLYEDLMDMRSEDRPEGIMDHQALGYTEEQIRRIAYYYGVLSGKAGETPERED
jgi:sulfide dehydrogenase cytochrome subunit